MSPEQRAVEWRAAKKHKVADQRAAAEQERRAAKEQEQGATEEQRAAEQKVARLKAQEEVA